MFQQSSSSYSLARTLVPDLVLTILIWFLYWITWQLFGEIFYAHYFESYNIDPHHSLPGSILNLFSAEISKSRYFQINLLILVLPIAILIGNLIVYAGRFLLKYIYEALRNFILIFGAFLLVCTVLIGLTRTLAIVHVILIITAYLILRAAQYKEKRWKSILIAVALLATTFFIIVMWRDDVGFIINYLLVAWFISFTLIIVWLSPKLEKGGSHAFITKVLSIIISILIIPVLLFLVNNITKPSLTDEVRFYRRIAAVIHEDKALATGGRQFIGDAQFLQYAKLNAVESFKSPSFVLADKARPLHPLVSKGLYTVIINDLNPLVFLDYGGWFMLLIIALLWLLLYYNRGIIWRSEFNLNNQGISTKEFQFAQLVRYIPGLIIISNSVWMFLSLFGIVFFTGRLVNGFGVDSASDWLETIMMFAFMGYIVNSYFPYKEK